MENGTMIINSNTNHAALKLSAFRSKYEADSANSRATTMSAAWECLTCVRWAKTEMYDANLF